MIHPVDARLLDEARRFHLVFACVDCASFDPGDDDTALGRCSLGFPHEMHRDPKIEGRSEVIFCKTFELR
ncbi:MAG: hypothetical protein ABI193_03335 [Minicystis sp.]